MRHLLRMRHNMLRCCQLQRIAIHFISINVTGADAEPGMSIETTHRYPSMLPSLPQSPPARHRRDWLYGGDGQIFIDIGTHK